MDMGSENINKQLEEIINEPEDTEEYVDQPLSNQAIQSAWNFMDFIQPLDIPTYSMFRYNGFVVLQWGIKGFKIVGDRAIVDVWTQRRYDLITPEQMLDILNLNTKE
jgi:hypothetical protein